MRDKQRHPDKKKVRAAANRRNYLTGWFKAGGCPGGVPEAIQLADKYLAKHTELQ